MQIAGARAKNVAMFALNGCNRECFANEESGVLQCSKSRRGMRLDFFRNRGLTARKGGCRRIGEFLRAAGLVSEEEISSLLNILYKQGNNLRLGDALSHYGLLKPKTVQYFVDQFVLPLSQSKPESKSVTNLDVERMFGRGEYVLVVQHKKQLFGHMLRSRMYSIGRERRSNIQILDEYISRRHAFLIRGEKNSANPNGTYEILDCGRVSKYSKNSIYVNGKRVHYGVLKPGDKIQFGPRIYARFMSLESVQDKLTKFVQVWG